MRHLHAQVTTYRFYGDTLTLRPLIETQYKWYHTQLVDMGGRAEPVSAGRLARLEIATAPSPSLKHCPQDRLWQDLSESSRLIARIRCISNFLYPWGVAR
jgi:hypothetical protein